MYLQQTLIHQFMINVFYRGAFENSGEKNKRGSVDLDIFTVGVSTFCATTTRATTPISGIDWRFRIPTTHICDFQQQLPIII